MAQQNRVSGRATTVRPTALYQYQPIEAGRDFGQLRNCLVVTYHDTDVVIASGSDLTGYDVILNTGGWKTATTKTRMNQFSNEYGLPFNVYQRDYTWYIAVPGKADDIVFDDTAIHLRIDAYGLYHDHEAVRLPW